MSVSINAHKSKKEGNDHESIQSNTTPAPGYQKESDNSTSRHHDSRVNRQIINHMVYFDQFFCILISYSF